MYSPKQKLGNIAEEKAWAFLEAKGFTLLEKNYRCFLGEIDLIMLDQLDIVFIEVRSKSRTDYGDAFDSVTPAKIKKLKRAATHYLQKKNWLYTRYSRFDLIGIHPVAGEMQIEWIKNAF